MSWSLQLRNGDLTLGGAQLGAVTGTAKLVQDLRCALLEPMGNDRYHLDFGSLIDGGRLPDGTEVASLLGGTNWARISITIEAEIRRIASQQQDRQLQRMQNDKMRYGKPTLIPREVLIALEKVEMRQHQTTLICILHLKTGTGEIQKINVPLTSDPIITS